MKKLRFVLIAVVAMGMGCSVDSTDGGGGPDVTPGPDAGSDPVPTSCLIQDSFPDLGTGMGGAAISVEQTDNPGSVVLNILGALNGDAKPDVLQIRLFEGFGVFTNGFAPGTYQLTGAEASALDCGACITLLGDLDTNTNQAAQVLLAGGGSLVIDAIDKTPVSGRVTGRLQNVSFREIQIDQNNVQTDVPGGCTSSIAGVGFDVPVMAAQPTP